MLMLKYRAILKANMIEGLYRPFSKEPIVCLETSTATAKSACFMPFSFLNSSILFFRVITSLWKVYFPSF